MDCDEPCFGSHRSAVAAGSGFAELMPACQRRSRPGRQLRGHTYQCSGSYTVNDTTYFITAGGWSGYVDRSDGRWLFCDWQSFPMPFRWTYSIYLSPVKEPWCE
jgi:hypothetical protein